jgi:hypothetical protein
VPILQTTISVICAGAITLNVIEVSSLPEYGSMYPFESEFVGYHSIYASRGAYIIYLICFSFCLLLMCFFAWKRNWGALAILLIVNLSFLFYPIVTAGS